MQADAYRRARTHMGSHSDLIVARVLGAIQSFLLLGLLGIICLFVALMASRGEARFPRAEAARLPAWVANQGVPDGALLRFQNTGIFPLVANNLLDPNPAPPRRGMAGGPDLGGPDAVAEQPGSAHDPAGDRIVALAGTLALDPVAAEGDGAGGD